MQNSGSPRYRPKKKNKKGKGNKATTHSFWANLGNTPQTKLQPSSIFQTPDQQQEYLVDLTDDKAPKNPMSDATERVNPPETKHEDQMPKQQPVNKWTNQMYTGNRQTVAKNLKNPGINNRFYQEEDFTQDIDNIDFTDYNSEQNKPETSYSSQTVAQKQDTSIQINKSTEQKPANQPIILSNQLVNSVPPNIYYVTTPNEPVKSINQPKVLSNKLVTSVKKPVFSLNKPVTSATKPVTPVPKPVTSVSKPVTSVSKPVTSVIKPVTSVTKPVNSVTKPVTSVTNPVTPLTKAVASTNPPATSKCAEVPGNVSVNSVTVTKKISFQPFSNKMPTMESKNELPTMKQPANVFYNPTSHMPTMSYPKGIPKSFLQPRKPETMMNSQQNPQMIPATNTMPSWPPITPQYPQQFTPNPQIMVYNYMQHDNNTPILNSTNTNAPMFVQTDSLPDKPQQYSPSETYADMDNVEDQDETRDGSESPDLLLSSQKRLSAFKRLGPQTQPKKPRLTINLMFNKEQAVREVVDETDKPEVYKPVHLREDIIASKDDTVVKYLPLWPWKKNVVVKKIVSYRQSKSVMILELEQMQNEVYDKDNLYVQITIKGYPSTWKKERVLDVVLESVKGRSFIPIFIEFNENECKFLVIRCRPALTAIHKYGFIIRRDDVELQIVISQIDFTVKYIDFIPRLVLRKRLSMVYDGERKLNLKAFTFGNDISHFLYYPLHRLTNQKELVQLQSNVAWDYLTDLDLSHNKITTLQGFEFPTSMPKLKNLNLSHNYIEKATVLLACRGIPLNSIWLEGNPLCHDYTDPTHYVKVLKMMFPCIKEIDGTELQIVDKLPEIKKNYCPENAVDIVNKFLEVFFPLLECGFEQRSSIQEMYEENATMTITYKFKLRYSQVHRYYSSLFLRCRVMDEGEMESIEGSSAITKLITKWPGFKHDPYTFTVDVMHHDEYTTILRISGIVKLTAETLAEDEHLLAFTRTLVLHSRDGNEYKIRNEMVYWDEPSKEYAANAFQVTAIITKPLSLKLESTPDDDLKEKLIAVFMQLTDMERAPSVKCLETKEWNFKNALEYFTKLLKLDCIESI